MISQKMVKATTAAETDLNKLLHESDRLLDQGKFKQAMALKPQIDAARAKAEGIRAAIIAGEPFGNSDDIALVEIEDLPAVVASHLSGKTCKVEFDADDLPIGSVGECVLSGNTATIRIGENMSASGRFDTLLHETAHAFYNHIGNTPEQEKEAVNLAHRWLSFADQHYYSVGTTRQGDVERKMRALLLWKNQL